MKRRLLLMGIATLLVAFPLAACGDDDEPAVEAIPTRIAFANFAPNYLNAWAAWKEGIFAANGIEIVSEPFNARQSGGIAVLVSGDVDFIIGPGADVLTANEQGAELQIVAGSANSYGFVLVGRSELDNLEDLRGGVLGLSRPGGTVSVAGALVLERFGLVDDVEVQHIPDIQARLSAIAVGQLDAILVSPPVGQITAGGDLHVIYDLSEDMRALLTTVITTREFADESPEAVRRLLKSLLEAETWLRDPANRDAALMHLSSLTGVEDPDALAEGFDYNLGLTEEYLQISQEAVDNTVSLVMDAEGIDPDVSAALRLEFLTDLLESLSIGDSIIP